jgi:hypothetical protein
MHTPNQSTVYEMTMFDTDPWAYPREDPGFDKIVTQVYNRPYCGQQTGDMYSNDSYAAFDYSEMHLASYALSMFGRFNEESQKWAEIDPIQEWLDKPVPDESTFEGKMELTDYVRSAPRVGVVLADLVKRGELPLGKYILEVSW